MRSFAASAAVLATVALSVLAPRASAQQVTQQDDDPVSIVGTWSSGSGGVSTGLGFFNPGNNSFILPKTSGQSYSFTQDGFWEQALYLFSPTAKDPKCKQAQLIWQHGSFRQNGNGSLTLTPFEGDGRQLIQSGCTHTSESIVAYDQAEYMQGFNIRLDMHYGSGAYYLQMFEFDGTPKPWLWQTYNPPQMLPTQQLHKKIIGSLNG
ncbi:Chaperone, endoplasmic reticulum protein-folding, fungi [Ceraceosorus bombacis]|uniref:Protein ROT1 n=1 Tax=Ceraceosorus bombacis TaxID=401625 RepID=A0A0P1BBT9_9BASI|nr:Chaperone, endoplasmic reticulum protein-folding, fungi [Ceraceosorus bombacis]